MSDLGYSKRQHAAEACALILAVILAAVLARRIALAWRGDLAALLIALLLGYLAADFLSGIVHWAGDTWGRLDWPVLGNGFIRGFREHHVDPKAILRHGFVETSGAICFALDPTLGLGLWLPARSRAGLAAIVFVLSTCAWLFLTNEIHRVAHRGHGRGAIASLQRLGLILSPARHALHHAPPYDRYYCITSGVLNPILDRCRFFRVLEHVITTISGMEPRSDRDGERRLRLLHADGFAPNANT